ncbi:MAG: hypothetical protein ACJA0Q_001809 [Saprospiraceae bacterium]|jgi:hypothetical protein
MLGVSIGVLKPLGGDGQLFGNSPDAPHGDFGFSLGLDYWKKNLNSFEYHLGFKAKYLQYHFHYTPEGASELSGYFQMLYYSIPLSLHLSIPNYPYLQGIVGTSVASMNMLGVKSGNTSSYFYNSSLDLKWVVSPELFFGVNFMEEKTDFLLFKGSIVYSTFPLRNLSQKVTLGNDSQSFNSAASMPGSKIELVLTFYPKWKTKKSFSDDQGINCPTSF